MFANLKGSINKVKLPRAKAQFALYEAIVNSIQANAQKVNVQIIRENQEQLDKKHKRKIKDIIITDDGDGFNNNNFESFKTVNSIYKLELGGKGVGRLSWLIVFEKVEINSIYNIDKDKYHRNFSFNIDDEVKENFNEKIDNSEKLETKIHLKSLRKDYEKYFSRNIHQLALDILYHCLIYFLDDKCQITIFDDDDEISINDLFRETFENKIKKDELKIDIHDFEMLYVTLPIDVQKSHEISLVANTREVKRKSLINENSEFLKYPFGEDEDLNNVLVFLTSKYLDENVTDDRTDFVFKDGELFLNENQICQEVSVKVRELFKENVEVIENKNRERIENFLTVYPEYKYLYSEDHEILKLINPDSTNEFIEDKFNKYERQQKKFIDETIKTFDFNGDYNEKFETLVDKIKTLNSFELSKYVLHRKVIIDLLAKVIDKKNDDKEYWYEKDLHNLIFPMKKTSDEIIFKDHNLWLIDDRLSYHRFLASDKEIKDFTKNDSEDRIDIVIVDNPLAFTNRPDDEDIHNNVIIVEFKRPGRKDFRASDLIKQVTKYVKQLRENAIRTSRGREINITKDALFDVYIVCDLNPELRDDMEYAGFKPFLDQQGFYQYMDGPNTFIQIISLNKLLKDAKLRNKVFFQKLGLTEY